MWVRLLPIYWVCAFESVDLEGWALSAESVTVAKTRVSVVVTAVVMTEAETHWRFETVTASCTRRWNRGRCFRTDCLTTLLTNGAANLVTPGSPTTSGPDRAGYVSRKDGGAR